jgi:hypothetical protein
MTVTLVEAILADVGGLPKDEVVNTFVFDKAEVAADLTLAIDGFYRTLGAGGNFFLAHWLGNSRLRGPGGLTIKCYDITAHLDGSPHGGPFNTTAFAALPASASATNLPSQCAVSVYGVAAPPTSLVGVSATVPSTEAAIDQGAPATHAIVTRPMARRRAHIQFGPLIAEGVDATGHVSSNLVSDLKFAAAQLLSSFPSWAVWSRRDAAVHRIVSGWVDRTVHTVRRRTEPSTGRLFFP